MHENITLYHGTSVGWLHASGFDKPNFQYGELSGEDPFIYLCTERNGAVSAAYKACTQVKSRHGWKNPCLKPYVYNGVQYEFRPYVYKILFDDEVRVLDFYEKNICKEKIYKIKLAIVYARTKDFNKRKRMKQKAIRCWEWWKVSIKLLKFPEQWQKILHMAYSERRDKKLYYLAYFGFDLFKNIERDGDGQGYGEVWGLSFRAYGLAKISTPENFDMH